MLFNKHSDLVGRHAFLSASKYHWVNYSDEKLDRMFMGAMTAQRGSELHAFAEMAIRLGQKMPTKRTTMNMYVNEAIGYRMTPEVLLHYSDNCFGTADAVSFRANRLRIHDLKNGVTATSMMQLKIYAALFCLEYRFKPVDINIELRIYQNNDVITEIPDPDEITHIMDKIISFDKRINAIRMEAMS